MGSGGGGDGGKPKGMTRTAGTRGRGTLHAAGLHPTLMAGLVQPLKGLKSEKLGLLSAAVEGRINQASTHAAAVGTRPTTTA